METVSKEEQEIRDRIVKCMIDCANRKEACVRRFRDLHPGGTYEGDCELYVKCHRAVFANIEIEKTIKGNA